MKRILLTLAVTCIAASAQAGNPFAQFSGCYETIERNGEPVQKSPWPEDTISEIKEGVTYWSDENGKELRGVDLEIFQKYVEEENTGYGRLYSVMDGLGVHSRSDDGGYQYRFSGPVMADAGEDYAEVFTITQNLSIKALGEDRVFLHATFSIAEYPQNNADDVYVLQKIACPTSDASIAPPKKRFLNLP